MDRNFERDFTKHRLLSRREAAELLGVKEETLAIWQSTKRYQLPIVKVGRLVKYKLEDLLDFVERRTVNKPLSGEKDRITNQIFAGRP